MYHIAKEAGYLSLVYTSRLNALNTHSSTANIMYILLWKSLKNIPICARRRRRGCIGGGGADILASIH
jgi:hypothetical protein